MCQYHIVHMLLLEPEGPLLIHNVVNNLSHSIKKRERSPRITSLPILHNSPTMSAFDITTCARPNILVLEPYRCARE